jgi:nitroreductase
MGILSKISYIINLILILVLIFIFVKHDKKDVNQGIVQINTKGALKTIFERKSVREFTKDKVNKDTLDILLKAAMCAPTAGNRQPWSFVIVTEKPVLKLLADGLPYAQMLNDANAAIIVCGSPSESFEGIESEFWVQDCSAASENILIAVESMGLGACWTGVYPVKDRIDFVAKTLGIPKGNIPLNVIPLGFPNGLQQTKDKYKPEKIHWQKW